MREKLWRPVNLRLVRKDWPVACSRRTLSRMHHGGTNRQRERPVTLQLVKKSGHKTSEQCARGRASWDDSKCLPVASQSAIGEIRVASVVRGKSWVGTRSEAFANRLPASESVLKISARMPVRVKLVK